MSTIARHRVDNGPTVRITAGTLLAAVTPGALDRGRHARAGRFDDSLVPPLLLIGFGLLLIYVGAVWW